jgi:hypothetical protein
LDYYPKLNYLLNKNLVRKKINRNIIIAPTDFNGFPKLTIQPYLETLIKNLIKIDYKIIYRPHPSNVKEKKVLALEKNFKNFKNFKLDTSSNYFNSYSSSNFMITDISGTAYTYAFLTKNPVFFSHQMKKKLKILTIRILVILKIEIKLEKFF